MVRYYCLILILLCAHLEDIAALGHCDVEAVSDYDGRRLRALYDSIICQRSFPESIPLQHYMVPDSILPAWENTMQVPEAGDMIFWIPLQTPPAYVASLYCKEGNDGHKLRHRLLPVREMLCVKYVGSNAKIYYVLLTPYSKKFPIHRSQMLKRFIEDDDHGDFSGILIYYDLEDSMPCMCDTYRDGKVISHFSLQQDIPEQEFFAQISKQLNFEYYRVSGLSGPRMSEGIGSIVRSPGKILFPSRHLPYYECKMDSLSQSRFTFLHMNRYIPFIDQRKVRWVHSYKVNIMQPKTDNCYAGTIEDMMLPNAMAYVTSALKGDFSSFRSVENNIAESLRIIMTSSHGTVFTYDVEQLVNQYFKTAPTCGRINYARQIRKGHYILTSISARDTTGVREEHVVNILGMAKEKTAKSATGRTVFLFRDVYDGNTYVGPRVIFGDSWEFAIKKNRKAKEL